MRDRANDPVAETEAAALFGVLADFPALVLAVSGGPDSTALLWLAARWRDSSKFAPKLIAVTVDHGLRPESAKEAAAVKRLARSLNVEHRTVRWSGAKPKTGIQAAARQARYALLVEAARKARSQHIVTAHTQDDQAETVLFRLARGSGIGGLGGMHLVADVPVRGGAGISLIRPLLTVPKARLAATLAAHKVPFAEDPSNRDPRFARPRIRALMPVLAAEGLTTDRVARLARRAQRAEDVLARATEVAAQALLPGRGPAAVDLAAFLDLPAEISLRLLARMVGLSGREGIADLAQFEVLLAEVMAARGGAYRSLRRTLAGALITVAKGKLTVETAPPRRTKRSLAKTSASGRKGAFTKRS